MSQDTDTGGLNEMNKYQKVILKTANKDGVRPETCRLYVINEALITSICARMASKVACENHWNQDVSTWTDEGKLALEVSLLTIATCADVMIQDQMTGFSFGTHTDSYLLTRAIVKYEYFQWTAPSETYLCA
tara:strand:+ start:1664 stop:2059 length:396 start_codon:yes stop_codon:yes gene_type:complete